LPKALYLISNSSAPVVAELGAHVLEGALLVQQAVVLGVAPHVAQMVEHDARVEAWKAERFVQSRFALGVAASEGGEGLQVERRHLGRQRHHLVRGEGQQLAVQVGDVAAETHVRVDHQQPRGGGRQQPVVDGPDVEQPLLVLARGVGRSEQRVHPVYHRTVVARRLVQVDVVHLQHTNKNVFKQN